MEERAILTAFSDLVLCVASVAGFKVANDGYTSTVFGFFTLALASGLGCFRFAVAFPKQQDAILKLHEYFSFLGSAIGLPLLASSYCMQVGIEYLQTAYLITSVAGPVLHASGLCKKSFIREFSSTLAVLSILIISLFLFKKGINFYGVFGSLAFVIGGLVIGTKGNGLFGLANVDWFHYALSMGVLALGKGLAV